MIRNRMKKFLLSTILMGICLFTQAQDNDSLLLQIQPVDTAWKKGGDIAINFSRVGLSNWAGGGQSSLSLATIFNLFANYEQDRNLWENKFNAAYGLIKSGEGSIRKSDDILMLESKYSYKFTERWWGSALINFRSQFDKGYEYNEDDTQGDRISQFLAPGYIQAALGITYRNSEFTYFITLSPVSAKFTIVTVDELTEMYGVEAGENFRGEFGATIDAGMKREILPNVDLESNINLFSNYENPSYIDVNWTVLLLMNVNKYITSSISTQLIYDHDIMVEKDNGAMGRAIQFKNVINVGLAYKFGQK